MNLYHQKSKPYFSPHIQKFRQATKTLSYHPISLKSGTNLFKGRPGKNPFPALNLVTVEEPTYCSITWKGWCKLLNRWKIAIETPFLHLFHFAVKCPDTVKAWRTAIGVVNFVASPDKFPPLTLYGKRYIPLIFF